VTVNSAIVVENIIVDTDVSRKDVKVCIRQSLSSSISLFPSYLVGDVDEAEFNLGFEEVPSSQD